MVGVRTLRYIVITLLPLVVLKYKEGKTHFITNTTIVLE